MRKLVGLNKKINDYDNKQKDCGKESFITLQEESNENMVMPFRIGERDKDEEVHMQSEIKDPEVIEINENKNTRPKRNIVKPDKFKIM